MLRQQGGTTWRPRCARCRARAHCCGRSLVPAPAWTGAMCGSACIGWLSCCRPPASALPTASCWETLTAPCSGVPSHCCAIGQQLVPRLFMLDCPELLIIAHACMHAHTVKDAHSFAAGKLSLHLHRWLRLLREERLRIPAMHAVMGCPIWRPSGHH